MLWFVKNILFWVLLYTSVFAVGMFYHLHSTENIDAITVIKSDGVGYYSYLPSVFIQKEKQTYSTDYQDGYYLNLDKNAHTKHNKFFIGSSFLMLPFFVATHQGLMFMKHLGYSSPFSKDGYSLPYQLAIMVAGVFYLIVGLIAIFLLLGYLEISNILRYTTLILFTFGTQLLDLATYEASYAHIYAFAVISWLLWLGFRFTLQPRLLYFFLMSLLTALLALIRPTDVLVLLIFPLFLYWNGHQKSIKWLKYNWKLAFPLGIFTVAIVIFIQLLFWKLQTGSWIIWSYESDEHFNFFHPEFFNVLFSFKKGLFVYTPLLAISLIFILFSKLSRFEKGVFLLFFVVNNYVIASWWCWWYGGSFGMRAWIEFIPVFMLLSGVALSKSLPIQRYLFFLLGSLTIPINFIQMYQYSVKIMHWDQMNYEKYKQIFLRTDPAFHFVTFDPNPYYKNHHFIDSIRFSAMELPPHISPSVINENKDRNYTFTAYRDSIYRGNFSWKAPDVFPDTVGTVVKIRFEGKLENVKTEAIIVASSSLENSDNIRWDGYPIMRVIRSANQWKRVEVVFDRGKKWENEEEFSIYFYNKSRSKLWIRNIEVVFYYYELD